MHNTIQKPSLEVDYNRDHCALTGNRPGLELLREAVDHLLGSGEESVLIDQGRLGLELVMLDESASGQTAALGWKERLLICLFLVGLFTFLSATVFGFYHLIKLFN